MSYDGSIPFDFVVGTDAADVINPESGRAKLGCDNVGGGWLKLLGAGTPDGTDGTVIYFGISSEQIQDIVGGMFNNTATISFSYDDPTGKITANINNASITEAMLSFSVATQAELDAVSSALAAHIASTSAHNAANLDFTPQGGIAANKVDAAIVEAKTDAIAASQPLDATLTALSGQNWAADAIPVGTGADTVTQLAAAASRTLVKKSTGSLIFTAITDYVIDTLYGVANATGLTALLDLVTITVKGLMSPADKIKVDNLWFDATNHGMDAGTAAATNTAALDVLYDALPNWATVKFPARPGLFWDFSAEQTMNRDIRVRFLGDGKGRSILRSTSATANMFNQTVDGFYISFEELGFGATVTKTAGSALRVAANNAYFDVRGCEFQAQFRSIDLNGTTAGNVGTIKDCLFNTPPNNGGSQIRINGSNINMMIQNCTIDGGANDNIGIEILSSGAVQIGDCDIIAGRNCMLLNSTGGGIAAVFMVNGYLDQARIGPALRIIGTASLSRIKFIGVGITNGANGLNAIEIAGTGTGTGIPEAIDFFDCDVYNNGYTGTTYGFVVTGVRGFTVRGCRVAGFTDGIRVSPYSANGITNFDISGNTIGPTENFVGNGTGINVLVGSFEYGNYSITDNDLTGNTSAPLVDGGTIGITGQRRIQNNLGMILAPTNSAGVVPTPAGTAFRIGPPVVNFPNGTRIGTMMRATVSMHKTAATASTVTLTVKNGTSGVVFATDASILALALAAGTAAAGAGEFIVEIFIASATTAWVNIKYTQLTTTGITNVAANSAWIPVAVTLPAITNINTLSYWSIWLTVATAANITANISWEIPQQ